MVPQKLKLLNIGTIVGMDNTVVSIRRRKKCSKFKQEKTFIRNGVNYNHKILSRINNKHNNSIEMI